MSKKRNYLAFTLVVFMLLSLLPVGAFAETGAPVNTNEDPTLEAKEKTVIFTVDQKSYKVGDQVVETDVAPYIKDLGNGGGRTMVPVAFVAPALGTEPAQWFPNDQMVLITKGEKQIAIFIGKNEMLVNGKKMPMDVAAEIKDIGNGGGRTMLPIAFIARALEIGYEWEGATRSVYFYGYTKTYDQKGTFGPDSGIQTIDGSVVVKADGVILQNLLIKGNLTIAEEVGDGDVTLNNITVKGETFIRGGGKDSIHINGGEYSNIIIQNVNGKVRVVAKDVTGVQVVVAEEAQGEEIILEGSFEKVTVEAEGAKITTQGQTTINEIVVAETAKDTEIELAKDTVVKEMVVQAKVDVQGQGTIEKAEVKANDVNLGIAPKEQNVDPGVTTPTTETTAPSTPPSSGGGGGGGGGSSKRNQAAPTGLKGIAPTSEENNDGRITGTTTAMEYRLEGSNNWIAVEGDEITGLGSGTYEIRYKAKSGYYAGDIAEVKVPAYEAPKVDKDELKAKINEAQKKLDDAKVGNEEGNYPQEALDALEEAIATAQAVVDNEKSTQEAVDKAVEDLTKAISIFNGAVIKLPNTYLLQVISEPANGGKVTVTEKVYGGDFYKDTKVVLFEEGHQIKVIAEPNKDYEFKYWDGEGIKGSKTRSYAFSMPANDVTLTANFETVVIPVSAISVTGVAKVGETQTAKVTPEKATVNYQWMRCDSEDGAYKDIDDATNKTYELVADDVGKYIIVKATGTGNYKGTVESEPVGPVEAAEEEPEVVEGTWNATGNTGFNTLEGTAYVFQEFELLVDGERISLHKDNVKSITSNGKELTPNTDHTLWFNVLAETGEREFVVVDNDDVTYKATLDWTAPEEATATAEGEPSHNDELKATYQKYNVAGVDLVEFDAMYQIKPESGDISELNPSGDNCLWFKVGADEEGWAQEEGNHIFLVKHGETWSKFVVNYKAEEEPVEVPSTYAFSIGEGDLDNIVANQEATIDVTFATVEKGDYGYDGVRFKFNVDGDGDATFIAMDSEGKYYEATNEGYWGPGNGFTIDAEYEATTPWTVTFSESGEYTVIVSLIDADSEEVVAGITETFTVNVQAEEPVEPSIPELTVTGPNEEIADDADSFEITFAVSHDKELEYLEIDHNLGKHGSLPSEVEGLPEFKLYPNTDNPWGSEEAAQQAEAYGVSATYGAANTTWVLTFGGDALDQIRDLTSKYTDNQFKIYSLVCDVNGNKSGSMYDGSYEITVVTLAEVEEPVVPEVYGSMTAYGSGNVVEENGTYTATFGGEIPWYDTDTSVGRNELGNRVGVKIFIPEDAGYDPADIVEIKIGENTYNWEDIKDGPDHFQWWPLVREAGQEFTATIKWNIASEQTFVIKIAEDATLADAPDTTAPELVSVSPDEGNVNLTYGATFKLEVGAYDENLYELEVDHSFEGTLPEFSVYASEENPYGTDELKAQFEAQGVTVTYNAEEQKWTIDFGKAVTDKIVENGGIIFYLVIKDQAGNQWGSMSPPTEENTFAYKVTQEGVPDEAQFVWDVNRIEGEGNMSEKLSELGNTAYEALEAVQKVEVAKLFILNRPGEGFADIAAIETALGETIDEYNSLLGAVNEAEDLEAMKTALQAIGQLFEINVADLMVQAALAEKGDGYESVSAIIAVFQAGQAALQAVNAADSTAAMQSAIEENVAVLGLNMESYNELIEARRPSVSVDLVSNKGEGYNLDSLKATFNAIVATRLVTQASMDKANNATTAEQLKGYVSILLERFEAASEIYTTHSGKTLAEKVTLLQDLVDRYNDLGKNMTAVLEKVLELRTSEYGGQFARSEYTTDAFATALTAVEAGQSAITEALAAINNYLEGTTYAGITKASVDGLQDALETLGLYSEDYVSLAPADGPERHTAVFKDLWENRAKENKEYVGYDLATLTDYFNAMVGTRLKTQESMDQVNNAETVEALNGISWVTLLNDHFESANYKLHSSKLIADKKAELQGLVNRYNDLDEDGQLAVLQKVFAGKPYARSQATLDALAAALTEVEVIARATIENLVIKVNGVRQDVDEGSGNEYTIKHKDAITVEAEIKGLEGKEVTIELEVKKGEEAHSYYTGESTVTIDENGKINDFIPVGTGGTAGEIGAFTFTATVTIDVNEQVIKVGEPIVITFVVIEVDPTVANVTTFEELKTAAESTEVKTINIMKDIAVGEKLNILSEKHINGNNKILTANSPEGWDSFYVLHFYTTTGSVKDIKITGADAAIYVNGSVVEISGTIDVGGNQFGGIEVSKGSKVTKEPKLTIAEGTALTNGNEANAIPTIWEDQIGDIDAAKRVVGYEDMKVDYNQKATDNIQRFYFLNTSLSVPSPVVEPADPANAGELKLAFDNAEAITNDFASGTELYIDIENGSILNALTLAVAGDVDTRKAVTVVLQAGPSPDYNEITPNNWGNLVYSESSKLWELRIPEVDSPYTFVTAGDYVLTATFADVDGAEVELTINVTVSVAPAGQAQVQNSSELEEAIKDENISTINITENLETGKK